MHFYQKIKSKLSKRMNQSYPDCFFEPLGTMVTKKDLFDDTLTPDKALQVTLAGKTLFHTYWIGTFGRRQAFCLKSLICTQNLDLIQIILWLDSDSFYRESIESNQYLIELQEYVTIKVVDFDRHISECGFDNRRKHISNILDNWPYRADEFRLMTLLKYGGLWFDLDIMFIKDLTPLLIGPEFVYRWEFRKYANNALIYVRRNSNVSMSLKKLYRRCHEPQPWLLLSDKNVSKMGFTMYPCYFFDPLWQHLIFKKTSGFILDSFEDFFLEFDAQHPNLNYSHIAQKKE